MIIFISTCFTIFSNSIVFWRTVIAWISVWCTVCICWRITVCIFCCTNFSKICNCTFKTFFDLRTNSYRNAIAWRKRTGDCSFSQRSIYGSPSKVFQLQFSRNIIANFDVFCCYCSLIEYCYEIFHNRTSRKFCG